MKFSALQPTESMVDKAEMECTAVRKVDKSISENMQLGYWQGYNYGYEIGYDYGHQLGEKAAMGKVEWKLFTGKRDLPLDTPLLVYAPTSDKGRMPYLFGNSNVGSACASKAAGDTILFMVDGLLAWDAVEPTHWAIQPAGPNR